MEDLESLLLNFEKIIAEPLPSSHLSGSRSPIALLWGDLLPETPAEHFDFGTLEEFGSRTREEVRRAIRGQLDKGSN